jgi:hypothetical protein
VGLVETCLRDLEKGKVEELDDLCVGPSLFHAVTIQFISFKRNKAYAWIWAGGTDRAAAAAAITAAVFGCFLVAEVLELTELGSALAIMKVAGGGANWWLPGFLERILPQVKVE